MGLRPFEKRHAALDNAAKDHPRKFIRQIVLSKYNVETDAGGVLYYPLYMTMFLR
jgi:hypothetical protein